MKSLTVKKPTDRFVVNPIIGKPYIASIITPVNSDKFIDAICVAGVIPSKNGYRLDSLGDFVRISYNGAEFCELVRIFE